MSHTSTPCWSAAPEYIPNSLGPDVYARYAITAYLFLNSVRQQSDVNASKEAGVLSEEVEVARP